MNTIEFIEECGFDPKSRAWKKADFFTLFTETDRTLHLDEKKLQPSEITNVLEPFYKGVEEANLTDSNVRGIYYKAALQGSNDRINRVRRGLIIDSSFRGLSEEEIMKKLQTNGL